MSLTRPILSVIPTFAISRISTVVFSFNALSNSINTSALISRILLILIRVNSFSLALAFFIQSSILVVLSGSGGTIFNDSPLAAAKNQNKKKWK